MFRLFGLAQLVPGMSELLREVRLSRPRLAETLCPNRRPAHARASDTPFAGFGGQAFGRRAGLLSALFVVMFAWFMTALMGQQLFGTVRLTSVSSFARSVGDAQFWGTFPGAMYMVLVLMTGSDVTRCASSASSRWQYCNVSSCFACGV